MRDENRTKTELIEDLARLRQRLAELEVAEGEYKQALDALQSLMAFNEGIIRSMGEGIVLVDAQGYITFTNPAADALLGCTPEELVGERWTSIVPPDQQAAVEAADQRRARGESDRYELELMRKDGMRIPVLVTGGPRFEEGRFAGSLAVFTDISEHRRAEQALLESEEKYRSLVEDSVDGIAIVEGATIRFVNPALLRMLGCDSEDEMVGCTFTDFVSPEYRELMMERGLARERGAGVPEFYEFRALRKDNTEFDAELSVAAITWQGRVARQGIVRDITERKRAEEALRESEERYRTLFEDSRDAVYITTRDGKFVDANQSCLALFGYTREEMTRVRAGELYVDPADADRFQQEIEQTGAVRDYEVKLRKKDGTEMDCLFTAAVRRAVDGTVIGYQGIIRDVTEQKRAEQTIKEMAYHDALTGLPNRTLFNDRLGVALAHARRSQHKLAVMLMDLDLFKEINDRLGHTVGDELLQAVGERLAGVLRESDTVCRMGGDEFLLLLPGLARTEHAGHVAERILEAIRKPFVLAGQELHITTSLGIAIYPEDGEDDETLVKNADVAMYYAKEKGRDNYQRYSLLEGRKLAPMLRETHDERRE